jgi:hypothetical protein
VFARASGNEVLRNRDLAELTPPSASTCAGCSRC